MLPKFDPVRVTRVPSTPEVGVIAEITGTWPTLKLTVLLEKAPPARET